MIEFAADTFYMDKRPKHFSLLPPYIPTKIELQNEPFYIARPTIKYGDGTSSLDDVSTEPLLSRDQAASRAERIVAMTVRKAKERKGLCTAQVHGWTVLLDDDEKEKEEDVGVALKGGEEYYITYVSCPDDLIDKGMRLL